MNKKDFRRKQKEILKRFAQTPEKKIEDHALLVNLFSLNLWQSVKTVGVTVSMPIEVDTLEIIAKLWNQGIEVYLAKVNPGSAHKMDFVRYTNQSKLKKSNFGVPEIIDSNEINNDLDLLIVPGLAFSADNHERLGFGGGYYDRFLARHSSVQTISLANSKMLFKMAEWPIENFDRKIDHIVSPNKIY